MAQTTAPIYDDQAYIGPDPALERLYDNVQAQAAGVLLPVVKMVSWNTIEDFYIRSTFRRELVSWCMPSCVTQIDFNPFDGDWLVAWILDFQGLTCGRIKRPALLLDMECPPQDGDRRGWALLSLKPVSLDTEFDVDLLSTWFETIVDGVLGRLYMQPAKPYSSQQLGLTHMKLYRAGVQRARAEAQLGYTSGPGRWMFPQFATGRAKN